MLILILSTFLPNPDDGKVSVESAKVEGMCGFITLPVAHPFLMANDKAISEVISFLKNGKFTSKSSRSLSENREPTAEKLDLARVPDNFR